MRRLVKMLGTLMKISKIFVIAKKKLDVGEIVKRFVGQFFGYLYAAHQAMTIY